MKSTDTRIALDKPGAGRLITFEGLDGTGKTTQAQLLASALRADGLRVLTTREPGGTAFGEEVRSILVKSRDTRIWAEAELALLFACRAQLLREVIEPALAAGQWVICDRFIDSSMAYQGSGRDLGRSIVEALHKNLVKNYQPWMTVLLDGDLSTSLTRARGRNRVSTGPDEGRFEAENSTFYKRVQKGFQDVAMRSPERVFRVDAENSVEAIHLQIMVEFTRRFHLLNDLMALTNKRQQPRAAKERSENAA